MTPTVTSSRSSTFLPAKAIRAGSVIAGKLFLGIDHSAIVVADSDASIGFYQRLGFHIAGTSENYGTEQEHLNNVFGAHLRISTLRADAGPDVELLEYIAPRDGRAPHQRTRIQMTSLPGTLR